MKKYSSVLILMAPITLLLGEENLESQILSLEEKLCDIRDCTVFGKTGAEFASGKPLDNSGFFVTADALYWKMFEGATEFVFADINRFAQLSAQIQPLIGKSKQIDFNWNWGYRVGAFYVFPCNSWDLYLNYTSLNCRDKKSIEAEGGILIPLYLSYTPINSASATCRWNINFSTLDLDLERGFFVSRYLNLKMHAGVRGVRINQKIKAHYIDIVDSITDSITSKNDFFGVGLRAGIDSQWFLYRRLYLCLDTSAALIKGRFHVTFVENAIMPFFPVTGELDDHIAMIVPNAQFYLGLGWEGCLGSKYYATIKIGYEAQYWWRQHQIPHQEISVVFPYGKRISEDLGMHGLTIKAEIDF